MANRRRLLSPRNGIIAWTLLYCGGCTVLPPHVRVQVVEADKSYRNNDYRGAEARLEPVLRDFPNHAESAEAYYIRALARVRMQRIPDAVADLEKAVKLSNRADLTGRANAALGGLYHDQGRYEPAAAALAQALRDLPEKPPADEVRYRLGVCLQRQGKWADARSAYSTLMHQFPGSRYAEDARRGFSWEHSFFSIQCGAFVNQSQAENLLRKVRSATSEVWVEPEARFGRPLHVVYAGKYATFAQAQDGLGAVRRAVPGAFVVP